MMGIPLETVVVLLGDSSLQMLWGSGGHLGANNSASGVYAARMKLCEAIAQKLGFNPADTQFTAALILGGELAPRFNGQHFVSGVRSL